MFGKRFDRLLIEACRVVEHEPRLRQVRITIEKTRIGQVDV